jgi:hypothetical protein
MLVENREALLTALQTQFHASKGIIKFDAAFDTPDPSMNTFSIEKRDTMDKQMLEVLVDDIYEVTMRRWRYELTSHE